MNTKPQPDRGLQTFLEGLAGNDAHKIESGMQEMAALARLTSNLPGGMMAGGVHARRSSGFPVARRYRGRPRRRKTTPARLSRKRLASRGSAGFRFREIGPFRVFAKAKSTESQVIEPVDVSGDVPAKARTIRADQPGRTGRKAKDFRVARTA